MGFGLKTDYRTGKEIDLDKTYRTIIKPAFEDMGFLCFRADEIKHSGVIDIPMYEHILKADFVMADISTLNANVLYELGVRHAVKKQATLIIAEDKLTFPFDLSHIAIDSYEHLGKSIDYEEVLRFREVIKKKVTALQASPQTDSPLYSLLPGLNTPTFTAAEVRELKKEIKEETSLSDILAKAEEAKNAKEFDKAKQMLTDAAAAYPSSEFLVQRLILTTYKSKWPDNLTALNEARNMLSRLNAAQTTDPETLGLGGAIHKRLFEAEGKEKDLDDALWFYNRGFYVKQDYYNGINAAYLYNVKANLCEDQLEAYAHYGQAIEVRKKAMEICKALRADKSFKGREDQEWIFLTMAEAVIGLGQPEKEATYLDLFEEYPHSDFALGTYQEQKEKLLKLLSIFKNRWNL